MTLSITIICIMQSVVVLDATYYVLLCWVSLCCVSWRLQNLLFQNISMKITQLKKNRFTVNLPRKEIPNLIIIIRSSPASSKLLFPNFPKLKRCKDRRRPEKIVSNESRVWSRLVSRLDVSIGIEIRDSALDLLRLRLRSIRRDVLQWKHFSDTSSCGLFNVLRS
jgi:hypothetical protein